MSVTTLKKPKDLKSDVKMSQLTEDNIVPQQSDAFVFTDHVQSLTDRALAYLEAGYAVHFSGPAGTGKTTLAFHVASKLGRPVSLIHGDDEFGSSDLIGREGGFKRRKLVGRQSPDHSLYQGRNTDL